MCVWGLIRGFAACGVVRAVRARHEAPTEILIQYCLLHLINTYLIKYEVPKKGECLVQLMNSCLCVSILKGVDCY